MPALAQGGRRVIAFDNRGCGASTVTPGPYTTAGMAADALALLDALGVARADVFGMSLGGMIAQELAIAAPERVGRLVLGCTHAGAAHAPRMPRETGRAFAMATDDWAERMRALAPFAFASGVDAGAARRVRGQEGRATSSRPRATPPRSRLRPPTTRSRGSGASGRPRSC